MEGGGGGWGWRVEWRVGVEGGSGGWENDDEEWRVGGRTGI